MSQLFKIVAIIYLIGVLSGQTGYGNPESPIVKPEIVRQKINKNTGQSVKIESASTVVTGNPGAPPMKPVIVRKKIDAKQESVAAKPVSRIDTLPVSSPKQLPDGGVRSSLNKPSSESQNPLPGQAAFTSAVGGGYDPDGKIDPFVPLLKEEPLKDLPEAKIKREKREPATPLERIDLTQLKLTAIIRTSSGFKAMVEETTGKGYIVDVGTYIGIQSGRVTHILKDRIVVEEEVEDALGNVANRNSELKFQKPFGE